MADGLFTGLVLLLAAAGFAALTLRAARAMMSIVLQAAEAAAASTLADSSARRGDLTTMHERREIANAARRSRRTDILVVCALACWLIIPPFTGFAPTAYAMAAPLWLLPYKQIKPRRKVE